MSHLSQLVIELSFLDGLDGNKEGDTFDKRSLEYQNYLIARDHKPSTVKKHFSEVKNITRTEARKK